MTKGSKGSVDITHIARLARMELSDSEVSTLKKDIESILEYVDLISKLDLENIEPTAHVTPRTNVYRLDEVGKTMDKQDAFKNAPEILDDNYIKVPVVINNE